MFGLVMIIVGPVMVLAMSMIIIAKFVYPIKNWWVCEILEMVIIVLGFMMAGSIMHTGIMEVML